MLDLWTNEGNALLATAAGKFRLLGQKPIARMDRVTARVFCRLDNRFDIKIRPGTDARQRMGLIGHPGMQAGGIVLGKYRNAADAEV